MACEYPDALPAGYRVEEYEIVRVLGKGGFAITYLAKDNYRDQEVALKEYFPAGHAVRASGIRVNPSPGYREIFDWGYRRFLDEARVQAKFRHPNIPALHRYLRANGTAYVAMEYVKGSSLSDVLAFRGSLPLNEWRPWLDRILDALEHVHNHDYLHRDIKPRNILIRETDKRPFLIDFGASRVAAAEGHTVVLTPEYAPLEQRQEDEREHWFTDFYSLATVTYLVVAGNLPPSSRARQEDDQYQPLAERFADAREWMAVVDRALALAPEDRPQTVAEWRKELNAAAAKTWMRGEPPTARDTEGLTALHRAAAGEPLPEVVALLLDDGADIHATAGNDDDWFSMTRETPLHRAAAANPNPAVTALLLDRGADVHANAIEGTPLHVAAEQNSNAAVVGILLGRGANVRSRDDMGMTPLHRTAMQDRHDIAALLFRYGASVHEYVLNRWDRDLLQFALSNHKDTRGCHGTTPLHLAAQCNAASVAPLLIEHGANVNTRDHSGKTPLHLAAQNNALDVMDLLIESGANPCEGDLVGRTPLHMAAWGNARTAVQLLLRRGVTDQSNIRERYHRRYWNWNESKSANQLVEQLTEGKLLSLGWTDLRPVAEVLLHEGNTPLHWAAFGDSRDVAELLLDEGADVHGGRSEGPTPLDLSALGNATKTAQLLMDRGANVCGRDGYSLTPLHWAALGNACMTMALLIDRGADVAARRSDWTPMFFAALGNAREAMELLLAHGAELGPQNTSGFVVRQWCGWRDARESLPLRGDSSADTLLHWAAIRDAKNVVELLLDRGVDPELEDNQSRTPLDYASRGDAFGAAELLLDRGANTRGSNRAGVTPLHSATAADGVATARLLLERGANACGPTESGTPLHMARSVDMAAMLLDSGVDVSVLDKNRATPLHRTGNPEVAQLLLHRGADIEATDSYGDTPLHSAAFRNASDVVRFLVNQGSAIDRTNHRDNTPLHLAASVVDNDDDSLNIQTLLSLGADVSAVNKDGKTPLMVAMGCDAPRTIVACLLDYGADINATDFHGNSPLHFTARYRDLSEAADVTSLLLERGADINGQDERGRTPLHIVAEMTVSRAERRARVNDPTDALGQRFQREASGRDYDDMFCLAQLLIDGNANIHIRDKAGLTALEALQRCVAAMDTHSVQSETVESFRVYSRSSVRHLFSDG